MIWIFCTYFYILTITKQETMDVVVVKNEGRRFAYGREEISEMV